MKKLILVVLLMGIFVQAQAGVKGAAAGAGIGAAVGHLVGGNEEAWIGAALGAAGGALIESNNKKFEKQIENENMARQGYASTVTAKPVVKTVEVEAIAPEKEDTWGMRSDEELKERIERERAKQEAWNNSF